MFSKIFDVVQAQGTHFRGRFIRPQEVHGEEIFAKTRSENKEEPATRSLWSRLHVKKMPSVNTEPTYAVKIFGGQEEHFCVLNGNRIAYVTKKKKIDIINVLPKSKSLKFTNINSNCSDHFAVFKPTTWLKWRHLGVPVSQTWRRNQHSLAQCQTEPIGP